MKKFNLIILSLLSVAMLIACDKLEDIFGTEENQNNPQIEINTPEILSATDGGNNTIMFSATENWTAEILNSRADGWCSIYPTSGNAGEATIMVTTQPNDTPDERSASIIIKSGSVSKIVKVSQKQKDALTITASKFEVGSDGGEVNIEIKPNIDFQYEIEESAKDWVKYEGTRALKTSTLIFKVAENEDIEKREARIQIKSGELNEVVTIYQNGTKPTIIISKSEYVISANGETIAVDVTSNVDVAVELSIDVDWITENTARALSTNTYYFDIAPSEEYEQRTAVIVFTNKVNNLSEVVKIVQTQKDAIIVAKEQYSIGSKGGQIVIEAESNIDFDVVISNDWIKQITTRSLQSKSYTFEILQNTDKKDRQGFVKLVSQDETISQTVYINQSCANGNTEDIENGDTNEW